MHKAWSRQSWAAFLQSTIGENSHLGNIPNQPFTIFLPLRYYIIIWAVLLLLVINAAGLCMNFNALCVENYCLRHNTYPDHSQCVHSLVDALLRNARDSSTQPVVVLLLHLVSQSQDEVYRPGSSIALVMTAACLDQICYFIPAVRSSYRARISTSVRIVRTPASP